MAHIPHPALQIVRSEPEDDKIRLEGRLLMDLAVGDVLMYTHRDGHRSLYTITRIEAYRHSFDSLNAGMTAAVWVTGSLTTFPDLAEFSLVH